MALTRIEYGALASSDVMNNNFEYLDNRISGVSQNTTSDIAGIYSNLATVNSTITDVNNQIRSDIQDDIETLENSVISTLSSNGLYITTYINGTSWYREYFSDSNKTTRVWLEQGFMTANEAWDNNETKTYNLVKTFSDANYTVVATSTTMYVGSGVSSGGVAVESNTASAITIGTEARNTFAVRVYACGK